MEGFFPGASRNDFKPKYKAKPNFWFFFPEKFSRMAVFFTLSSLKNDFSENNWVKYR